jgi:prepilin-type N-terminal cleavage/methylation domain-containing protein
MNLRFHRRFTHRHRGITLIETVIALAIIAVAVPLILAATAVSTRTRMNSETDTRSAWVSRNVQQELTAAWRGLPSPLFPEKPSFPVLASAAAPDTLLYDADGIFLARAQSSDYADGTRYDRAIYMVTVFAEKQNPSNFTVNDESLSRVQISIAHPARAPLAKRNTHSYTVLIPRQTNP